MVALGLEDDGSTEAGTRAMFLLDRMSSINQERDANSFKKPKPSRASGATGLGLKEFRNVFKKIYDKQGGPINVTKWKEANSGGKTSTSMMRTQTTSEMASTPKGATTSTDDLKAADTATPKGATSKSKDG